MKGVCLPMTLTNNGYFDSCSDLPKQVKANLINLLLTIKGERVHQPEFGCDIHKYIFEHMNENTIEKCRAAITNAVTRWLPYIQIVQISLRSTAQDIDNNQLNFYIQYRIIPNNFQDAIELGTNASQRRLNYYDAQLAGQVSAKTPWQTFEPTPLDRLQVWKENPSWDLLPDGRKPRPEIDDRQSRRRPPNIYQ
jgi:phage baseplate assembly protein W